MTAKSFDGDLLVYLMDDTPTLIHKIMHLRMLTIGRMQSVVRKISSWLTGQGRSLTVPMENQWDTSGCSKGRLGLMVRLKSTRFGLWSRVIHKNKKKNSSIHAHMWPD